MILPTRPHAGARLAALGTTLWTLLAMGCANPAPPHPPSLHLPNLVKDLTASRVGDQVEFHWTTPTKTTDALLIKGAMTAEICRVAAPASNSAAAPRCTPVKRLPVQPGPSQTAEVLPQPLTLGPSALLLYRIQIFNSREHSAGLSAPAFAVSGAAPPPVEQLHAKAIRSGVMVEWQPQTTASAVELDRLIDGAVTHGKTAPPKSKSIPKTRSATSKSNEPVKSPLQSKTVTPEETRLRTPPSSSDLGGTIDRNAQMGQTYHYTAQRVMSASLDGHSLEIRSSVSPAITVSVRDTFPPAPPTGLAAVPGGDTPSDRSIDLSWEPDADPDLAGYLVYRQSVAPNGIPEGSASRLTSTPIDAPAFSDKTALPGRRYAYHVTAIDGLGNESAPSAEVQESTREP